MLDIVDEHLLCFENETTVYAKAEYRFSTDEKKKNQNSAREVIASDFVWE